MKNITIPEIGDTLNGRGYCFKENDGGEYCNVAITLEEMWDDYETGLHFKGKINHDFAPNHPQFQDCKKYDYATFSEFDKFFIRNGKQVAQHNPDDFDMFHLNEDDDEY